MSLLNSAEQLGEKIMTDAKELVADLKGSPAATAATDAATTTAENTKQEAESAISKELKNAKAQAQIAVQNWYNATVQALLGSKLGKFVSDLPTIQAAIAKVKAALTQYTPQILESMARGLAFTGHWEELRLVAYLDSANNWTIGFGSLVMPDGSPVKEGDTITEGQAYAMFAPFYIQNAFNPFVAAYPQPNWMTDKQYSDICLAFADAAYNVGINAILNSQAFAALKNSVNPEQLVNAYFQLLGFNEANGSVQTGLQARGFARVDVCQGFSVCRACEAVYGTTKAQGA